MTFFLVLLVLIAIAALAPFFGADSRDFRERCHDGVSNRLWF